MKQAKKTLNVAEVIVLGEGILSHSYHHMNERHLLINDGKGNFEDRAIENNFTINGEIRDFAVLNNKVYVFRNNDAVVTFELNQ